MAGRPPVIRRPCPASHDVTVPPRPPRHGNQIGPDSPWTLARRTQQSSSSRGTAAITGRPGGDVTWGGACTGVMDGAGRGGQTGSCQPGGMLGAGPKRATPPAMSPGTPGRRSYCRGVTVSATWDGDRASLGSSDVTAPTRVTHTQATRPMT